MTVILLRTALLYMVIVFAIRLMGKRQLGELQPSELVITILVSNVATLTLEDTDIPLLRGFLPVLTLVCFEVLASWGSLKSLRLRRLISGSPKVIITNGVIDQAMLRTLRFSVDDLMTSLRMNGIFSPEDVQFAVVETNGSVSVLQRSACRPAEKADVHARQKDLDPPRLLVSDGQLREQALSEIGQDRRWLDLVLRNAGVQLREVFLMTADSACRFHIVRREGSA